MTVHRLPTHAGLSVEVDEGTESRTREWTGRQNWAKTIGVAARAPFSLLTGAKNTSLNVLPGLLTGRKSRSRRTTGGSRAASLMSEKRNWTRS